METFSPGFMEDNGIGWEALKAVNPKLIKVDETPWGELLIQGVVVKMSETPPGLKWVCRRVGADNDFVYLDLLGYSKKKLDELTGGVIPRFDRKERFGLSIGKKRKGFRMRPVSWVTVGPGRLALWPRPKLKYVYGLQDAGVTRLVTLLSEEEGAKIIGDEVQRCGVAWTWLPLAGARPPAGKTRAALIEGILALSRYIDNGESILIHCAAGMHRTGMVAYAVLRFRGISEAEALPMIGEMRSYTLHGIHEKHIAWGNHAAAELQQPGPIEIG